MSTHDAKTAGLLTRALVPLSFEARNVKPDDSAEAKAKADAIRGTLAKKFNVSPFLHGSLATGLNLPGNYDYDFAARITSRAKFDNVVKRLSNHPDFSPNPGNKPGIDVQVFTGNIQGEKVDLALMYGDKAKLKKQSLEQVRQKMEEDPGLRQNLLQQKMVAKNIVKAIPFIGKKLYMNFKLDTDKGLGVFRTFREMHPDLDKSAAVPGSVKQYRRALQLLHEGEHSFHGTRDIAAVARAGHLLPSVEGDLGKGVYWAKGLPDINYFNGGVITPTSGLQSKVLKEVPRPHAKGLGASSYFTTGGPHVLGKGDYAVEGFSRNPKLLEAQNKALSGLQRAGHVRRLSADALTEAYSGLGKNADVTPEQLQRLQRADVYGHRTSNLDPIISSGQLLSAAQAAKQGLLKDYEAPLQRGTRISPVAGPAKFRSEVFMTKGYYKGLPSDPEGVKFKVDFQGIEVRVERPKGFIMAGKDAKGVNWARRYKLDYGHIPKTLGGDGDGLDVFLGPDKKAREAYWVIQRKDDGTFDELKLFLGFPDRYAALSAYRVHIPMKYLRRMLTLRMSMLKALLGVEPTEDVRVIKKTAMLDEMMWLLATSA